MRGAHLPLRFVSGAVALDAATLRRVVGREGDPLAFVSKLKRKKTQCLKDLIHEQ